MVAESVVFAQEPAPVRRRFSFFAFASVLFQLIVVVVASAEQLPLAICMDLN